MNKRWASAFGFIILMVATFAWAAPVPDTGMTKCYNDTDEIPCPSPGQAFYGQDANYTINPMSYTKLDASGNVMPDSATSWVMVRDNVTGLIWEMKNNNDGYPDYSNPHDADNTYIWYDSNPATNGGNAGTPGQCINGTCYYSTEDFINSLNSAQFGGYSDWRLSTIKELDSIVNYDFSHELAINTTYFPNTQGFLGLPYFLNSVYWSSTTSAYNTGLAWGMSFIDGTSLETVKGKVISVHYGYYTFVRAVRGGQSQSAYVNNGNGTVTDTSTGLMWQQDSPGNSMTWEQALSYCENLTLAGYTDWRLPTKKELRSIVDYSRYNPAINTTYFPDTISSFYWSSTPNPNLVSSYGGPYIYGFALGMDFNDGNDIRFGHEKGLDDYVRAVRGGQSMVPTPPTPDIKANGIDGEITVTSGTAVSVAISLTSGDKNGKLADWWFAINSPWGWYFLTTSGLTQTPIPLYQLTPLYDFSDQKMIDGQLPVGEYEFFFGVYITPNDTTESPLYVDSVKVCVK